VAGSDGTTSGARRTLKLIAALVVFLLVLVVPFVILASLGFVAGPACGCAATPTHPPGWTPMAPPPVSPEDAAARASRLAGVSMTPARDWMSIEGVPISGPRGEGAFAFVDGNSGTVLEVVLEKQLPDSDTVSVSTEAASSAAQAFLSRGGVTTDGLAAQTTLALRASVAYYDVTWSAPGAGKPALEIRVNASSGAAFAYRELRAGIELTAPNVGLAAAIRLAQQSTYASGETANAPEMQDPDLLAYADSWSWMVGFPDGVLTVDAVTGAVSVAKWSSSR
jgi:hypothetical protein